MSLTPHPSQPGFLRECGWFVLTDVCLPLCVGGLIYLLWRAESLLMFGWVDAVGGTEALRAARLWASPAGAYLPDWVAYSIPDAVWVYACTTHFCAIWRRVRHVVAHAWRSIGWVLGFGGEVGQGLGFVPGTFDWVDLALVSAAAALAFWRAKGRGML